MSQRGFTLLETLVAGAVFTLVTVGALTLYATLNTAFSRGQSTVEVHQNARVALDRMAREVRVAGYDPSNVVSTLSSPTGIQTAESSRVTLVADVDRDGTLDQVTYRVSAGQLVRDLASWSGAAFPTPTASELADGLTALSFSYFDADDSALTAPVTGADLADIARVTISLNTSASTVDQQETYPLLVDVRLRN